MKTRLYVAFWACLILAQLRIMQGDAIGLVAFLGLAVYGFVSGQKEED